MTHALNILLVVGCVLSIAGAFLFSVERAGTSAAPVLPNESTVLPRLPSVNLISLGSPSDGGITRRLQLKTIIPKRAGIKVTQYVVQRGDSPSSIAQKFGIKPETILWGNDKLNAAAGSLKAGDVLNILPVDGVLHIVQDGDTLESLQALHGTRPQDIFEYPGNNFDLTQPAQLTQGQELIIPNGTGPISWAEAQVPGAALSSNGRYSGEVLNLGTGYFVWPVNTHYLTQEFWGGHGGIDIDTYLRQPVFAADSGTVTFSGWDETGYGNMVIINHGNGYKTYYSHNEANLVATGQTVVKGQQIAESGSTGNSTGEHLDFRILYNGTFVNPMGFLQ